MSHRYDNGSDYWTTPDKRLIKGAPFSTLESVLFLLELGIEPTEPLLKETTELIFNTWREDGRFKLYPQGAIYPCHTTNAANVLCHMGYASDVRLQKTFQHLLDTQYTDGGWRCNKFSFGRGPETEYSNPLPTLTALDAFRFSNYLNKEQALDKAVVFCLRIGQLGSRLAHATMELEHYSCRPNIPSVITTFLFMSMFYRFITGQRMTGGFLKP